MFNLLIVDDEFLETEWLKVAIFNMHLNIFSIETAVSGFEALEKANLSPPDILITDIKMPGMSGIELSEKIQLLFPDVEIIFISGHNDFTFLKSAIRLNAFEYILKPINSYELKEIIARVTDKHIRQHQIEAEKQTLEKMVEESKPVMRSKFLLDLIFGTINPHDIWEQINYFKLDIQEGVYCTFLIEIDDYKLLSDKFPDCFFEDTLSRVSKKCNLSRFDTCLKQFVSINCCRWALILSFTIDTDDEKRIRSVKDIANAMLLESKNEHEISITIAIGLMVEHYSDIYKSYNRCCEIMSQKMFAEKGTILWDYQSSSQVSGDLEFYKIDKELMRCVINLDMQKTNHIIDYLFEGIKDKCGHNHLYVQNYCINIISHLQLTLIDINTGFDEIFGSGTVFWDKLMKFDTIIDIKQWMKNIFTSVIEFLDLRKSTRPGKIVEKVIEYIQEYYSSDITLKEIAVQLFYSPNHLGHLFKIETGKGFTEYVNEYRMEKAKNLLESTTLRVYQVANTVGYKNLNSFIKQFKLTFGMTPKEIKGRC